MTRHISTFGLLPLGLALLVACGKSSRARDENASAASTQPAESGAAPAIAPPLVSAPARARDPICRALRVDGDVKMGGVLLPQGAELDGSDWVRLAKGASLTLKHANTGREISLVGPAVFRACRRGREQVLLAQGTVTAANGMGARPGADVLIATPVGAVRYADADFTLVLDEKRLRIEVRAGQVEIDPAEPPPLGGKTPKSPLRAKDELSITLGKPNAVALMERCREAAAAAESSARKVGDRSASEPLGERARAHVRARKTARVACTIAAAATGLLTNPVEAAGLWAEAARWEGLWESIPQPIRTQAPEK